MGKEIILNKNIVLPKLPNVWEASNFNIVWKIWISLLYSNSFIKFTIKTEVSLIVKSNLYAIIGFN